MQPMRSWRQQQQRPSSPPLEGESGDDDDQFHFPSEQHLADVSMPDNGFGSFNLSDSAIDDSPPLQPAASPTPLNIPSAAAVADDDNSEDDEMTPMPDKHTRQHRHAFDTQQDEQEPLSMNDSHLQLPRPSVSDTTATHGGLFADNSSIFERESRLDSFDLASTTDVAASSTRTTLVGRADRQLNASSTNGERERSTTLALNEQGKTIDNLNKENFELKLKIYYLEKRLDELAPDQVDSALKENVNLKVTIKSLTREVVKYKKIILDLNSTVNILQRSSQACTLPHGMTHEEKVEHDAAVADAARYREENERLHKMVADVSTENSRLRSSIRTSRTSSPLGMVPAFGGGGGGGTSPRSSNGLKVSRSNSNGSNRPGDESDDYWLNHRRLPTSPSTKDTSAEAEMYRREWLLAKQTIERQNQTIQVLRDENDMRASSTSTTSTNYKTPSDSLVRSILADRDAYVARVEQYSKTNHDLQENLGRMRERNSEAMSQLMEKNKELDRMHENMDELMRSLHDTKKMLRIKSHENQELRQELDALKDQWTSDPSASVSELLATVNDLRLENGDLSALVGKLKRKLKDTENVHQHETEKLDVEIENREEQFVALEAQVVKVMRRAEMLEMREKEKDMLIEDLERKLEAMDRNQYDDEIDRLEQELQVKGEQISEYERRMEEFDAQENDMAALEERYVQVEERMRHKDAQIKHLEEELKTALVETQDAKVRYEEDLQMYERQFQEVEQAMREREVRIASLEGHLEAQTDAIQREKALHREEVKELEDKLRELAELLHEKDVLLANMEEQLEQRLASAREVEEAYERDLADIKEQLGTRMIEIEEEWKGKVTDVETRLKETEELLKRDRRVAHEKLHEATNAKRTLHQKLEASSTKNGLINELLDQYQRSAESRHGGSSSRTNQALAKLNKVLQRELGEREQALQREAERLRELDLVYSRALQEKQDLQEVLDRRNSIITHLFERLQNTQERKAAMESVLLRQAIEEIDGGYDKRADSAMSSR